MFTSAEYYLSANNQAAGVVADGVAVVDNQFSIRNNHYIFTEDYEIVAATALGATLTAAQLDSPSIDAFNPHQIYPVNATALTLAANPNFQDLRDSPIKVPQNEEIQFKIAGGAGGAEADFGLLILRCSGPGAPQYPLAPSTPTNPRFVAIGTATLTNTIGTWSPFAAMAFTNSLRGGAYQLNQLYLVCNKAALVRVNFVKQPIYQNRKLFPVGVCDTTYGNQPLRFLPRAFGGLGRFNNFELPQISTYATVTAGATAFTFYADLTYLGAGGADAMP